MGYEKQRQRLRLGGIAAADSAALLLPSRHPPHQPTQHMRSPRDVVGGGCGEVQANAVRKALVGGKQLTGQMNLAMAPTHQKQMVIGYVVRG